jgi:arylsulfatase A-like enzyme
MIRLAAIPAILLAATPGAAATAAETPNIILILADDLGYGDLGCYGQQAIRTPRIDQLAAEGMLFTSHYAGSTVCAPSRCALMTGLHTGHARIRVPLIARWPGTIPAGARTEHVCASWDLFPTFCELASAPPPDHTDGISFVPTLLGQADRQPAHPYLYWEFHEQGKKQAVRMGPWKGVRLRVAQDPDGPIELYNLRTDIGETTDVAAGHPDIVARIATILREARTPSARWPIP